MKYKTTVKEIKGGYHYIVSVGYCELQHLLKYESPASYSCGVYGWNADYYDIGGVCIATGYRRYPDNRNVTCDYKLAREYDDKAMGKSKSEIDTLLEVFISKVKNK